MYDFVKQYMFKATYWVIAVVVYDDSENDFGSVTGTDLGPEKPPKIGNHVKMKKNTSWGHFSTGTFTPDREFY